MRHKMLQLSVFSILLIDMEEQCVPIKVRRNNKPLTYIVMC